MHLVRARALALIGSHFLVSFLLLTIPFIFFVFLINPLVHSLYLQVFIESPSLSGLPSELLAALFYLFHPFLSRLLEWPTVH